jgi:hypothetical protein
MTSRRRPAPAPKLRVKTISLAVALEELRQPGYELVSLHLPPPGGGHYATGVGADILHRIDTVLEELASEVAP